jgi:uncharacterized protein YjaZ
MKLIPTTHPDTSIPDTLIERIQSVIARAEKEVANGILKLTNDVTIIIDTDPNMIDLNIGIGGYTDDDSQIQLSVDPTHRDLQDKELFATLVHELSHVKRAYGPGYGTTLFDYLIFEGLGVAFEEEVCGSDTYYPNHLRTLHDGKQLVEAFEYMFNYDDTEYDYMDFVLGNSNKGIPKSAVYSMGFFIVEHYLAQSHKKASELLLENSDTFITREL